MCIRDRSTQSTGSWELCKMARWCLVLLVLVVHMGAAVMEDPDPEEDAIENTMDNGSPKVKLALCRAKREKHNLELAEFHKKSVACSKKLVALKEEVVMVTAKAEEHEPERRARSVREVNEARDGQAAALEMAKQEKDARLEAEASCNGRIVALEAANKAAASNRKGTANLVGPDPEATLREVQLRLGNAKELADLTRDMTTERESMVKQLKHEREVAVDAAKADAEETIKSMLQGLESEEARLKAEQALAMEHTRLEAEAEAKQASQQRDLAVSQAVKDKEDTLAQALELRRQLADVTVQTSTVEQARTRAGFELASLKKSARQQLDQAKHDLELATKEAIDATEALYAAP
eukprot:TRINITY_DN5020_c0_g1_i1.p1 TRINITY_DN5020_c0_g1~~TRINITY_DN5020_c0_g1_i1.p1  ORF type:complete len:352 (-),score=135.32 TRINITY_DN5020_c0_g1_i1:342-1397(-)